MLNAPPRPLPGYAPRLAPQVLRLVVSLLGVLLLLQIPRVVHAVWVGFTGAEIPMTLTKIEVTVGQRGAVYYSCQSPRGALQTGFGTREIGSFAVGHQTTGTVFPYFWGASCVPGRFRSAQPLGGLFIVGLLLFLGGAAFDQGPRARQLLLLRRLLRRGAVTQGLIESLTEKDHKRFKTLIVEYGYAHGVGQIAVREERGGGWSFLLHDQRVRVDTQPRVGQRVQLLYDEERPRRHLLIGFLER
ncbi:MAG: hypothetical protein IT374_14165 [Polyangiaceae bacterium]|nr:hypothetical protein [Polyangiaceae bacterium]